MFGLNWGELVVIGIVALIAIGPKELPTVLRTIGHWMGKMRRMANEFQYQFQEALREAELGDLQKHAKDLSGSVSDLATMNPLAEEQRQIERIGEGAGELPNSAIAEPAAAPAGEATAALPEVAVPVEEPPSPVTEQDFAAAEPEAPAAATKPEQKQAGGGA